MAGLGDMQRGQRKEAKDWLKAVNRQNVMKYTKERKVR